MVDWTSLFGPSSAQAAPLLTPEQRRALTNTRQTNEEAERERQRQLGFQQQQQKMEQERAQQQQLLKQQEGQQALETARQQQEFKLQSQKQDEEAAQRQRDIADALKKKEAGQPFAQAHPWVTKLLPPLVDATAMGAGVLGNMSRASKLNRFNQKWADEDTNALKALEGKGNKTKSLLGAERLGDFEKKWPEMQELYKPGASKGSALGWGTFGAEAALVPTEYDLLNPDRNPKMTNEEYYEAIPRALMMGVLGAGASKLGGILGPSAVSPYTGGAGTMRAIANRFPPPKAKGQAAPPSPFPAAAPSPPQVSGPSPLSGMATFPSEPTGLIGSPNIFLGKSPFNRSTP